MSTEATVPEVAPVSNPVTDAIPDTLPPSNPSDTSSNVTNSAAGAPPTKVEETPQYISDPSKATRVSIKVLDANSLPSSSSSSADPDSLLTANVWVGGSHEKVRRGVNKKG
jgi:hypothetical protein